MPVVVQAKSHGQPSISMETPTIMVSIEICEPAPTKAKIKVGPGLGNLEGGGGGGGGGTNFPPFEIPPPSPFQISTIINNAMSKH